MKNRKVLPKDKKKAATTLFVPVRNVKNAERKHAIVSYGQITPNREIIIAFEVQGKLEKGKETLKPGTSFHFGQILYKINPDESLYTLKARKASYANLIVTSLPDIEMDYPSERNKWVAFLNGVNDSGLLPDFPYLSSAKEKMFITSRNIITEYYNIKSLEERLAKYIYTAPFNGTVTEIFAEPGSIINPGVQVAKIAETGEYEIKVPIALTDLELFKEKSSAEFTDAHGNKIGTGKIIRISDVINRQTQSADVYYSIKPEKGVKIYNGLYVNVSINREVTRKSFTLPRAAVKTNKVQILDGEKIISQQIYIVGNKPDSVFVTGLNDGDKVILERVEDIEQKVKYKGIQR